MQIEIMRHHRRPDDADGDVEHLGIGKDLGGRRKAPQHRGDRRRGGGDLDRKTDRDHDQERDDERFEEAKALVHQEQQQECVERGNQRAAEQGNAEQKFQRNRGADDFGEIAGDDRRLAGQPEQQVDGPGIGGAASLREIAVGDDAEPGGQRLQQDRHQVRDQDDRQQGVAKLRAAREVGRPVARVHVPDRDQVAGTGKGQQPAPPVAAEGDGNGPVHFRQAALDTRRDIRTPASGTGQGLWQGIGGKPGDLASMSSRMTDN